jgi:hypothetical protein
MVDSTTITPRPDPPPLQPPKPKPSQGKYTYDCPADRLLDVSWHYTANDASGAWSQFLMRPTFQKVVEVS